LSAVVVPGPATSSPLGDLQGLAVDTAGNVFFIVGTEIGKITPSGTLSIIAGNQVQGVPRPGEASQSPLNLPMGLAVDAAGNLYVADQGASVIEKITPSGILSVVAGNLASHGPPTPAAPTARPPTAWCPTW
jgi:DNA-binding beta-propeller fold protein YncE